MERTVNLPMEEVLAAFGLDAPAPHISPMGLGHVNDTFLLRREGMPDLVLQRISATAFHYPDRIMENMQGITAHLRKKILAAGGDPERETLTVFPTRDGAGYYTDSRGGAWRVTVYISRSVCCLTPQSPSQLSAAGEAFGRFQYMLADYPAHTLHETILRFHDTEDRLTKLTAALRDDPLGRAASCRREADFILARSADCSAALDAQRRGVLPLRVTHNDTKFSNILFDEDSGKAICVIDLDTVMPGLAINDFGDMIRTGAHHSLEDERDLSRVVLDTELYERITAAFLRGTGGVLTEGEIAYLPWGAKLMTLECGIRFLTDYLVGDVYFHIAREGHNLDRCRTQLKLVSDMEAHWDALQTITKKYA